MAAESTTKICWADIYDSDREEESPPPAQKAAGEKKAKTSKKSKTSKSDEKDTEDHYFKGDVADLAKQPEVGTFSVRAEHPPAPQQWLPQEQPMQQQWQPEQLQYLQWQQQQVQQVQQFYGMQMCPQALQQLLQWQMQCDMGSAPCGTWNETPVQCQPKQKKRQQKKTKTSVESNQHHSGDMPRKLQDYARVTPEDWKVLEHAKGFQLGAKLVDGDLFCRVLSALLKGGELIRKKKVGEILQMSDQKQQKARTETTNGWLWQPISSDFKLSGDGIVVIPDDGVVAPKFGDDQAPSRALQALALGLARSQDQELRTLGGELVTRIILNFRSFLNPTGNHALCLAAELATTPEQVQPIVQNMKELLKDEFGARVVSKVTKKPADFEIGMLLAGKAELVLSARPAGDLLNIVVMVVVENVVDFLKSHSSEVPSRELSAKLLHSFGCLSDAQLYDMVVSKMQLKAITELVKGHVDDPLEVGDMKSQTKMRLTKLCHTELKHMQSYGQGGVRTKANNLMDALQ